MEKTFTNICPIHKNNITTTRIHSICEKKTGEVFYKPMYYCKRCHKYYIIVEEIQGLQERSWAEDGIPIVMKGMYGVIRKDGQYEIQNPSNKPLSVNLVPNEVKKPYNTICPDCKNKTNAISYIVCDKSGNKKNLQGRMCFNCGNVLFKENTINKHTECFKVSSRLFAHDYMIPQEHSNRSKGSKSTSAFKQEAEEIIRPISRPLIVFPIDDDKSLPCLCPLCGRKTVKFTYRIKILGENKNYFQGRKCKHCNNNYFLKTLTDKYPGFFLCVSVTTYEASRLLKFEEDNEAIIKTLAYETNKNTLSAEAFLLIANGNADNALENIKSHKNLFKGEHESGFLKWAKNNEIDFLLCNELYEITYGSIGAAETLIKKFPVFVEKVRCDNAEHFIPKTLQKMWVEDSDGKAKLIELPNQSEIKRSTINSMAFTLMKIFELSRNEAILELDHNGWTMGLSFTTGRYAKSLSDKYQLSHEKAMSLLREYDNDYNLIVQKISEDPYFLKQEYEIGIADVVVRTNILSCVKKEHKLLEVQAIVYYFDKNGQLKKYRVMAGYCANCKQYYMLEEDYQEIKKLGALCCRVVDLKDIVSGRTASGLASLRSRSLLNEYGYNVNSVDALSDVQRRDILSLIIDAGILTKTEICSHIDWCIRIRNNQRKKFGKAISKWEDDRQFVKNYIPGKYDQVIVKSLIRK